MKEQPIPKLLSLLTKEREFELPEDVSRKKLVASEGSLKDVIRFARTKNKSGAYWLLSLILTRFGGASTRAQIIQPHAAGMPGFANKPLAQPEQYIPSKARPTMARQSVVAAVVSKEHAKDERYIRSIINNEVPNNVVASCEDLLINGNGSKFKGLLHTSDEERLGMNEERLDFFYKILGEYASRAGRMPTHIILPYTEILKLLTSRQQRMAYAAQGFRLKMFEVFGVPVIESDAIPENHGLVIAADEIVLYLPSGLKWKFGHSNNELKACGLATIMLEFEMGLMIKRPETIRQLYLHAPFERNHTPDVSKPFHKS